MANHMISSMGIFARPSWPAKCRWRASISRAAGLRWRGSLGPISRSFRQMMRASSTASVHTSSSPRTEFAVCSTTSIQMSSYKAVAAPTPLERRDRMCLTSCSALSARASNWPTRWRSRNSRCLRLLPCTSGKLSRYQRNNERSGSGSAGALRAPRRKKHLESQRRAVRAARHRNELQLNLAERLAAGAEARIPSSCVGATPSASSAGRSNAADRRDDWKSLLTKVPKRNTCARRLPKRSRSGHRGVVGVRHSEDSRLTWNDHAAVRTLGGNCWNR